MYVQDHVIMVMAYLGGQIPKITKAGGLGW